jgi:uncharacterized Ntn-hydrolase superfamily protein
MLTNRLALLLVLLWCPLALTVLPGAPPRAGGPGGDYAATFSIVAHDPSAKMWGVAVASKYLAVGSAVPFAKAGVGAVATQASVNVTLGPKGLELMEGGKSAKETVEALMESDKGSNIRQFALVDGKGEPATYTGKGCIAWAGGKTGKHYAVQGNILAGEKVIDEMATAYDEAETSFPWRLMAALEAGEKAGGDKRGKQSAAILVVREGAGPNRFGDRFIDLRVDDHTDPIPELARLLRLRMGKPPKAKAKDG